MPYLELKLKAIYLGTTIKSHHSHALSLITYLQHSVIHIQVNYEHFASYYTYIVSYAAGSLHSFGDL